jgi:predicted RNase H-like HicB family nuclease
MEKTNDSGDNIITQNGHFAKLEKLSQEDGGGWLVSYPELRGCYSIGATRDNALERGLEAVEEWIRVNRERHPTSTHYALRPKPALPASATIIPFGRKTPPSPENI